MDINIWLVLVENTYLWLINNYVSIQLEGEKQFHLAKHESNKKFGIQNWLLLNPLNHRTTSLIYNQA